MFNVDDLISKLKEASVLSVLNGKYSKNISISFPTEDLDNSYDFSSLGKGFTLSWDAMEMVVEQLDISSKDFYKLYNQVLIEMLDRNI